MDPNANLKEQEEILGRWHWPDVNGRIRSDDATRLSELRQALYDWIRDGGFEPDWSACPLARKYYGR